MPVGVAPGVLGRARLGELQRARILSAVFDVICERGVQNLSIAHVVDRSGVSRRTFYEHFSDRDDCYLAAFDRALARASEQVLVAYRSEGSWRERIRAGLVAFLLFLENEPQMGRVLVCQSVAGAQAVLERRAEVFGELTRAVREGEDRGGGDVHAALTAEGVVGGVLTVIQARLEEVEHEPLLALTNQLMGMIVLPYLGVAARRRELARALPQPASVRVDEAVALDPFKDAGMRLTYRTARVLLVLAERPNVSNRIVGELAGIGDQGQISKLLRRLQRLGLIVNSGLAPGQGAPNAWSLTAKGRRMADRLRVHSEGTQQAGWES
jgi:AcrR family transcriptional regulator/DNA-binding MarR family transcriptional regulator